MPWNGNGIFSRIYSWVADKAAGLDISSTRMDTDSNDIVTAGLGNALTRDGQGQPTANLPMNGFRHTGVQNAVNRSDYAALGQVQDGLINWSIAGGSADALTASYTPSLAGPNAGQLCFVRAIFTNLTTTPTFAPVGIGPQVITKLGAKPLGIGDIQAGSEIILRYNPTTGSWELLNPSNVSLNTGIASTGVVWLTIASTPPTGWLMFDDGTFGSATSGSSNSNNAANQALFNILFAAPFTDATAPLFTSTGAGTTRVAQGSAAAAWAANCRMSLPKTLGRALAVAGSGGGLTARTLGQTLGEETHLLTVAEQANMSFNNGAGSVSVNSSGSLVTASPGNIQSFAAGGGTLFSAFVNGTVASGTQASNGTFTGVSGNTSNGGGGAHNNMQPSSFMNAIVKT